MKTKQLLLCSLFCALNIIFAQLIIPTLPVQISLSVIPVLLSGLIMPPRYAALTQAAYLLSGAAGLPVLGKFSGGIGALLGPSGGYALSYPLMAFLCGFILKFVKSKGVLTYFLCQIPAMIICYTFGSVHLALVTKTTFYQAFLAGVVPFVLFDILKITVCAFAAPLILKKIKRVI